MWSSGVRPGPERTQISPASEADVFTAAYKMAPRREARLPSRQGDCMVYSRALFLCVPPFQSVDGRSGLAAGRSGSGWSGGLFLEVLIGHPLEEVMRLGSLGDGRRGCRGQRRTNLVPQVHQLGIKRVVDLSLFGRGRRAETEVEHVHEAEQIAERRLGAILD